MSSPSTSHRPLASFRLFVIGDAPQQEERDNAESKLEEKAVPDCQAAIENITDMGIQDVLSRKTGVIVGDDVLAAFKYAQEKKFAIPAIVRQPIQAVVPD